MKREVLCMRCGRASVARHGFARNWPSGPDGPAEFVRHVEGVMKLGRPIHDPKVNGEVIPWTGPCICDFCGCDVPKGVLAVARTMGHGEAADAPAWEGAYLSEPPKGHAADFLTEDPK